MAEELAKGAFISTSRSFKINHSSSAAALLSLKTKPINETDAEAARRQALIQVTPSLTLSGIEF